MKQLSTEALSNEYLHVNSCGCQDLYGCDVGSTRPNGRIDYHILYITEGCCFVTVNNNTVEAPAGSVIVYFPRERQEYKFRAQIKSRSYYIHFSGTACDELMKKFQITGCNIFYIGKSTSLINLYEAMIEEYHLKLNFYDYTCQSLLLNILSVIGRKISNKGFADSTLEKKINEVCRYILANYSKNLSVNDCAKICNLSESRFSHLFKSIIGISPMQYILNVRIESAKELLINTDFSIAQISEETGFCDQNYFSRIFKKYTGFSPSQYRKL